MDLKTISEKLFDLEKKNDLFNKKIAGVYFWKLVRFELVKKITREKKIFGQDHSISNQSLISKINYAFRIFANQRNTSAIARDGNKRILIFDHPRKVRHNNEYVDIYTYDFISKLDDSEYEVIERSDLRKHFLPVSKNRSYEEYFSIIDYFKYILVGKKLDESELKFVLDIESQINSVFDLRLDIRSFIVSKINNFYWKKKYYSELLERREPKIVYLVVSYGLEALISACKDKGIETVEFQHGTMSRYHFGYSFPNNNEVPYFPDKIRLFGQFWKDSTPLPITERQIEYHGFPHLKRNLITYNNVEKKEKTVLFVSQGTIGAELSKIALELAKKRKDLFIIFKLHPGEILRWREEYADLVEASILDNFEVLEKSNVCLHALQAKSEFQVGVYSTAIYEGLTLKCKTILINLNGIEYMEFLINNRYVKLAHNSDELGELISESVDVKCLNRNYIFCDID